MAAGSSLAGIVVGDDDGIRTGERRRAHERALATIPVATGAEDDDQTPSGMRAERRQQPCDCVGRMGVVDIGRGAVGQGRREFHAAAHADEARQPVEDRRFAEHQGDAGGKQSIVRLEAARQRQVHVEASAAGRQGQNLAVGPGRRTMEGDDRAALANSAEVQVRLRRYGRHRLPCLGFQRHRSDGGRATRQQVAEQPQLGGPIGGHAAVVVEVVAGQVGEGAGAEPQPIEPELVETM